MTEPNFSALSSVDPVAALREAGLTNEQANKFVGGDGSAIAESLNRNTQAIDLRVVHDNYMPNRSFELMKWFFDKARMREEFTAKEAESTRDDYITMFEAIFAAARSGGFDFKVDVKGLDNSCVKVDVLGSLFIAAEVEEDRLLLYLPE